ncbi:ATP-binding protein [Dyadobacter sp. LHD-138]|uniref:ATP-binding protein n=1 Tax=Dyadobacter sp. LHD-138 TaxID=3071413 RepID=UPI0027DF0943|nr:ATP-binding protein [Dyadobacter sp. LHD-138]MDQ6480023.1 ATP-binding protein [Dyadobacter sp. LHD-138]
MVNFYVLINRRLLLFVTLAFVLFVFLPNAIRAQVSPDLLKLLPDSCKPVPKGKVALSITEQIKILEFSRSNVPLHFKTELDRIASGLAEQISPQRSGSENVEILSHLTTYYAAFGNYALSMKYCSDLLDLARAKKVWKKEDLSVSYERFKGYLYSYLGNYEEAVRFLYVALERARLGGKTTALGELYAALSGPYESLGLYDYALSYQDSALYYYGDIYKEKQNKDIYKDVLVDRLDIYLKLFEEGEAIYREKIKALIRDAASKNIQNPVFKTFSAVDAYFAKDFDLCIYLCDSLLVSKPYNAMLAKEISIVYLLKYKALSLMKVGREGEAVVIFEKLISDSRDEKGMILRKRIPLVNEVSAVLYKYYKEKNRGEDALVYLEINKMTGDSMDVFKNRGHIFEVEQKYNFVKKEAQVKGLEGENMLRGKERDRAIAITIIALLSLVVVGMVFYNRNRKLKIKEMEAEQLSQSKIEKLSFASQIQIAALEERNRLVTKIEQKRISMELHDDLAGTLASAKMLLEQEARTSDDKQQGQRLFEITNIVEQAYLRVRTKSHEWFRLSEKEAKSSFSEIIENVMAKALPRNLFEQELLIDDESLVDLPHHIKIELLRIIQEGITNILKHSKAQRIDIILYKDQKLVVMHIRDNGKGFDSQSQEEGMGLRSIKERVVKLNGQMNISSDARGTELVVELPA